MFAVLSMFSICQLFFMQGKGQNHKRSMQLDPVQSWSLWARWWKTWSYHEHLRTQSSVLWATVLPLDIQLHLINLIDSGPLPSHNAHRSGSHIAYSSIVCGLENGILISPQQQWQEGDGHNQPPDQLATFYYLHICIQVNHLSLVCLIQV